VGGIDNSLVGCIAVFQRQRVAPEAAVPAVGGHPGRHRASLQGDEVRNEGRGAQVVYRLFEKGSTDFRRILRPPSSPTPRRLRATLFRICYAAIGELLNTVCPVSPFRRFSSVEPNRQRIARLSGSCAKFVLLLTSLVIIAGIESHSADTAKAIV